MREIYQRFNIVLGILLLTGITFLVIQIIWASPAEPDPGHPWSKIGDTESGTDALPVARGGTGQTSLTTNYVILGNGTDAVQFVAPGTSGNVLTSDGTTWASAAGFPTGKLAADVVTTSTTAYTTIFSYTPPASADVRLNFYLIDQSSVAGGAVQHRVRSDDTGNVGNCMFNIPTAAAAATFDLIAIVAAPADDGGTAWLNTGRTPVWISCAFTSDATPGNVVLEFQGEVAGTYTVHAGSYYVAVTNQ